MSCGQPARTSLIERGFLRILVDHPRKPLPGFLEDALDLFFIVEKTVEYRHAPPLSSI